MKPNKVINHTKLASVGFVSLLLLSSQAMAQSNTPPPPPKPLIPKTQGAQPALPSKLPKPATNQSESSTPTVRLITSNRLGLTSVLEADGAVVCVVQGSHGEAAVAKYFAANSMGYQALVVASADEMNNVYVAGACDLMAVNGANLDSALAVARQSGEHMSLPENLN